MQSIKVTEKAQEHIRNLLETQMGKYKYVRLGTTSRGCAGVAYKIEFAEEPEMGDEIIEFNGFSVVVDTKSLVYLIGLELDFKQNDLEEGFVFNNPNKKGECGCGESFFI